MSNKTSILALQHMEQSGKKLTHSEIIRDCLKSGFKGHYQDIAKRCGLSEMQVVRRLAEIPEIHKTGAMSKTSSGQLAEHWAFKDQPSTNQAEQLGLFNAA